MPGELQAVITSPLRAPRDLAGLASELCVPSEYLALRQSAVYAGHGVGDGGGLPVLLLPGFMTSESVLQVMGRWLARVGYRPQRGGRRLNLACAERSVRAVERRVAAISEAHGGRRIALVGHSRGGQFTRVVGVRRPDLVRGVVTLGMPPLDPAAINLIAAVPAIGLTALGTAGVPGFMRASCFRGDCCADFRTQLTAPLDPSVAHVAVHSPQDGIVDHRRVSEPHARRVSVRASHAGMLVNPEVYRAVAQALWPLQQRDQGAVL